MKFLLFNIVVGAGLFYLFTASPDDLAKLSDQAHVAVDKVSETVIETRDHVKTAVVDMAEKAAMEREVKPSPKDVTPERERIRKAVADNAAPPPPPPLPEAEVVAEAIPQSPNDAQALANADHLTGFDQAPEPELMTARERHHELSILAEDMESVYLHYSLD